MIISLKCCFVRMRVLAVFTSLQHKPIDFTKILKNKLFLMNFV